MLIPGLSALWACDRCAQEYFASIRFDGLPRTITLLTSAAGELFGGSPTGSVGPARDRHAPSFSSVTRAATSQTVLQLMLWRLLLGIGMGGEWASGAVLVSETWPAEHRTKAISIMQSGWALGYIMATLIAALVLDVLSLGDNAWRWLFAVGVLPALFTLWIRRSVVEPAAWTQRKRAGVRAPNPFRVLFGSVYRRRTILATLLSACVQFANWGLFFWLPGFLATRSNGAAPACRLCAQRRIIPVQLGAYLGYLSFGSSRIVAGRRRTFIGYLVTAAILCRWTAVARAAGVMLVDRCFGSWYGYFSLFG